jgi:hypothetical protein
MAPPWLLKALPLPVWLLSSRALGAAFLCLCKVVAVSGWEHRSRHLPPGAATRHLERVHLGQHVVLSLPGRRGRDVE